MKRSTREARGGASASVGAAIEEPAAPPGPSPALAHSRVPKRVVCPICATAFEPRAGGGRCPVCGEQVVPAAAASRHIAGISPAVRWLGDGGWRLTLVLLLVAYELALFIFVWVQLAHKHLI